MPSHKDVIHDLSKKVSAVPKAATSLFAAMCDVYDCRNVSEILADRPTIADLSVGLSVEKLLLIVKWLFIEQDFTYWLQTGRNMLMSAIDKDVFGL